MANSVTVRVPATSANLGPGFDCLGMALDLWATIRLDASGRASNNDPMAAMALTAARRVFSECHLDPPSGLNAVCVGDIPIARGLGASAVARVGGALAANEIAGGALSAEAVLALSTEVSVLDGERVLHVGVPIPAELRAVLFVPELRMPTKESRRLLPDHISRVDAVYNTGRAALMVSAVAAGRFDLLDAGTQDRLHQKRRSKLFPAMFPLFEAAKAAGAHCAYLSGGGSTICALATENEKGIADAMLEAARARETPGRTIITRPTASGAEVVETK